MYCTVGSTTHMSGKPMSVTKLNVRLITPVKIAEGQVTRNEANVRPMTMPMYFARSPSNILMAIKFIVVILSPGRRNQAYRVLLKITPFCPSPRLRKRGVYRARDLGLDL